MSLRNINLLPIAIIKQDLMMKVMREKFKQKIKKQKKIKKTKKIQRTK